MNVRNDKDAHILLLRKLFGENRAEWPPGKFKDLFVPPAYIQKLESVRPSILVGGRGTGKTTSLQSLGYKECLERLENEGLDYGDLTYLGILVRINKNRVHAFSGSSLDSSGWKKAFAHYFNLLVCQELAILAEWLEEKNNVKVGKHEVSRISLDLGFGEVESFSDLKSQIRNGISKLQLFINNPKVENVIFSMQESPLRVFVEVFSENNLLGERVVFCCIDEYENLLDYQQGIVNTYIKHAVPPLSYKIGVRKYGIRNWNTIDDNDLLNNPADFSLIEIVDEGFDYFASGVANARLAYARNVGVPVSEKIDEFLENMSIPEEAIKLGADRVAFEICAELKDPELKSFVMGKASSEVYFLKYWQEKEGATIEDLAADWKENQGVWKTRLGNHGYTSLFWLTKGRKGTRIRKYYSGLRTVLALSGGNIRYFLELIDGAIACQAGTEGEGFLEAFTLSPQSQTLALRQVGKRRLDQIEGLSNHGVQLKRLVLAIGKVFFELGRSPANGAPEVNSFVISGDNHDIDKIRNLLEDGVGHLAFEVSPRTKSTSSLEIKDEEFRLHRIFSGFFEISHRKKRRTTFNAKDLLEIVEGKPQIGISSLLKEHNVSPESDLPEQLAFFTPFYQDAKG